MYRKKEDNNFFGFSLYLQKKTKNVKNMYSRFNKKKNNIRTSNNQMIIQRALSYCDIYDDFDTVDINDILSYVPTSIVIYFISKKLQKVQFQSSNSQLQRTLIREFLEHISDKTAKERVWKFLQDNNECLLYENMGCFLLYRLLLKNYVPEEKGETYKDIRECDYEYIFKAILYCNQIWTNRQTPNVNASLPLEDITLLLDCYMIEFKFDKDFRTQLYKSSLFFEYLESSAYAPYVKKLCEKYNVKSWQDYLLSIFDCYTLIILKKTVIEQEQLPSFLLQFKTKMDCINNDNELLKDGPGYLRDEFIYPLTDNKFIVLNSNLLVDKLYQGLRFDLYQMLREDSVFSSLPDYFSYMGKNFSEERLFYNLMEKTFNPNDYDKCINEKELSEISVVSPPDYYIRKNDSLFLFEYKDAMIADDKKYSKDINKIKEEIKEKICFDNGKKRKGFGQLLNFIDMIFKNNHITDIDNGIVSISRVYPIVIVTDSVFSSLGVNKVIIQEYDNILKKYKGIAKKDVFISIPIIIHIDTLITLCKRLYCRELNFENLIWEYITGNCMQIQSFDSFIREKYPLTPKKNLENTMYVLNDFMNSLR